MNIRKLTDSTPTTFAELSEEEALAEQCRSYHHTIYRSDPSKGKKKRKSLIGKEEKNGNLARYSPQTLKISEDVIRWTWPPSLGGVTGCCRSSLLALDLLCQAAEPAQIIQRDIQIFAGQPQVRAAFTCSCQSKRKRYSKYQELYFNPQGEIIFIEEWIFNTPSTNPLSTRNQNHIERKRLSSQIPGLEKGRIDFGRLQEQSLGNVWLDRIVSERRMHRHQWLVSKFHWILTQRIVSPPGRGVSNKRHARQQKQVIQDLHQNKSYLERTGLELSIDIQFSSASDDVELWLLSHPSSASLRDIAGFATAAVVELKG